MGTHVTPAACRVLRAVGIADADTHASLLPEDKVRLVLGLSWPNAADAGGDGESAAGTAAHSTLASRDLETNFLPKAKRGPLPVGFVGDGLNDCPALASAHVGVVLQEVGSQATVDAASAVLQADIGQLPAAIIVARRSSALVMVNLFLALAMNLTVIGLAATIWLPLWTSVLADNGGLLVVLANSLWPLAWRVRSTAPSTSSSSSASASASSKHTLSAAFEIFARPNVRALAVTLLLSTTWTLAQVTGAQLAHSSSLLSDALAMLVDDFAYALNLAAEVRP